MGRISFVEFAKLVKVNKVQITKAWKSGRLTRHEDEKGNGYLIEEEAMRDWVNNTRESQILFHEENPSAPVPEIPNDPNGVPALIRSREIRENFKAKIEKLKYEEMLGQLVDIQKAQDEFFTLARKVRDSLMAIPDRISAQLAAETNQYNVHRRLDAEIRIALRDFKEEVEKSAV